jgi:hypothetical protein
MINNEIAHLNIHSNYYSLSDLLRPLPWLPEEVLLEQESVLLCGAHYTHELQSPERNDEHDPQVLWLVDLL